MDSGGGDSIWVGFARLVGGRRGLGLAVWLWGPSLPCCQYKHDMAELHVPCAWRWMKGGVVHGVALVLVLVLVMVQVDAGGWGGRRWEWGRLGLVSPVG